MDILSALKTEASKLQKQLNSINSAVEILGGKNRVDRVKRGKKRRMSASARARIAKATKSTVGEGEGREEECLNPGLVLVRLKTEIPYFPRRSRDACTLRAFLQFIEPPTHVSHLHAQKANDDSRMAGRLINDQPQDV